MSRGFGRVQWGCLLAIWWYERERKHPPTTFDIAAWVYKIKRDNTGDRLISDAQHVAVKRRSKGYSARAASLGLEPTASA